MSLSEVWQQLVYGILNTKPLEYIAVFTGIASVWFSRIENIWVYPVGLISTIIYTYLSLDAHLPGEASVNIYYSVMSVYGWILWAKKDAAHHHVVVIQHATKKEWGQHFLFFGFFYVALFSSLTWLRTIFSPEIIPWADALASATAFTGMWLMAKKKVESWFWWIATNIASIPLYFVKGYVLTSVFYFILLCMAGFGWAEWNRRAQQARQSPAS
ncbi:nicotinamide riboside transporter PnuC [Paraflavitalea sp. CAU 1676]|uniref:nicotinamide riboside transporter PnuC n=1 Tax=Paraflavitalea sp. CAU 1676 TaxID=3032598 RepID=UPI0023D9A3FC|nr:nicotinamide riboside transporter PnuC [Paraflavitalea sp. CAU 1676]MDF2191002.1 nicotinamide riboside transporter PnuC [Paraflavitalea sp. CAU 1676]